MKIIIAIMIKIIATSKESKKGLKMKIIRRGSSQRKTM